MTGDVCFKNLQEITTTAIVAYEIAANVWLVIIELANFLRLYKGESHAYCPFWVRLLGPRYADKLVVVKNNVISHKGSAKAPYAKGGRK